MVELEIREGLESKILFLESLPSSRRPKRSSRDDSSSDETPGSRMKPGAEFRETVKPVHRE